MYHQWQRDTFEISTDPGRLDLELVHRFLSQSYWAPEIPLEIVGKSIEHSLPFGLYQGARQIGFARAITDRATFAYLADVFVLEEFRGQGLGQWLVEVVASHPELQELRRWVLLTRDAHALYRKVGFTDVTQPERYMERRDPDVYKRRAARERTS